MAISQSLNERLDSLGDDGNSSMSDGSPDAGLFGNTESPPEDTGQGDVSGVGFIGIEPEEQSKTDIQNEWKLAENLSDDTIIAYDGDKPLTVRDLRDGSLRYSDYTKKTQEVASIRNTAQGFIDQLMPYKDVIEGISSEDANARQQAILKLAEMAEVELPRSRPRDENGRYVAQPKDEPVDSESELIDLDQLIPGTDAYEIAERFNKTVSNFKAQTSRLERLEQSQSEFFRGLQMQQQEMQLAESLGTIAEGWKNAGLPEVDTESAKALVGQPITPEMAMFWANRNNVFKFNAKQAIARLNGAAPDEIIGSGARQPVSAQGKGLYEFVSEKFG